MDRPIDDRAQAAADTLALADWRRRMNQLYAAIRAEANPQAAWTLWRNTRDGLFRSHAQSPLPLARRKDFTGLPVYPYDPAWRFVVGIEPLAIAQDLDADGGRDGAIHLHAFARTSGLTASLGAELTLYWIGGYGGGIFLPLKDATAGSETYAGGRYLLDGIKGADLGADTEGRIVLDFNFSYHPSCCHSHAWVCPLAPVENHLDQPIRAGEYL